MGVVAERIRRRRSAETRARRQRVVEAAAGLAVGLAMILGMAFMETTGSRWLDALQRLAYGALVVVGVLLVRRLTRRRRSEPESARGRRRRETSLTSRVVGAVILMTITLAAEPLFYGSEGLLSAILVCGATALAYWAALWCLDRARKRELEGQAPRPGIAP